MRNLCQLSLLILFFILVGCSNSTGYKNEDVVAIVRGEEITIGDLRFLYPDEKIMDAIEGTVKAVLVIQEAKKLKIDVAEEVQEIIEEHATYPAEEDASPVAEVIRNFADSQAKKLGMEPEDYYKKYIEATSESMAYMNAYVQEIIGEFQGDIDDIDEYNEQGNEVLNELVAKYKDEIKIFIN